MPVWPRPSHPAREEVGTAPGPCVTRGSPHPRSRRPVLRSEAPETFLPFNANAFSIYLFYSLFIGLPRELEEAARLDGASTLRIFFSIILPNSKPVFASVAILSFLMSHGGATLLDELGFNMTEIGARYHGNLIPLFEQARMDRVVADIDPPLLIMLYFGFFNGLMLTYGAEWPDLPKEPLLSAVLRLLGHQTENEPQENID